MYYENTVTIEAPLEPEYKFTWKKCWIHLKTILKHKWYVFHYCCKCGIPWQGITHDLSKFSPSEFLTNVKYAREGKSPIDVQKEEIGFSFPWQHHKGHNPHHYEFWMDNFDKGCYVNRMPYKYTVEMLCDHLGASKAYLGKKSSYKKELEWWTKQREIRNMHPDNIEFLDTIFTWLKHGEVINEDANYHPVKSDTEKNWEDYEDWILCKGFLTDTYWEIVRRNDNPQQMKIKQPQEKK